MASKIDGLELAFLTEMQYLANASTIFRNLLPQNPGKRGYTVHPGEDGKWFEALVAEFLKRHLPRSLEVSTGFIANPRRNTSSYQIDLLVHDPNKVAPFLRYGEAVVVHPDSVYAAISIKHRLLAEHIEAELTNLGDIGNQCNAAGKIGPYLGLVSGKITGPGGNWNASGARISKLVGVHYEDIDDISSNEIVDSIVALDGYILHVSKGKLKGDQAKKAASLLWGNRGGAMVHEIGTEIIEGIYERLPGGQTMPVWPPRNQKSMQPISKVPVKCFGRPPRP